MLIPRPACLFDARAEGARAAAENFEAREQQPRGTPHVLETGELSGGRKIVMPAV
jgi:hypothetical protein